MESLRTVSTHPIAREEDQALRPFCCGAVHCAGKFRYP
jgi:hypothetical protein